MLKDEKEPITRHGVQSGAKATLIGRCGLTPGRLGQRQALMAGGGLHDSTEVYNGNHVLFNYLHASIQIHIRIHRLFFGLFFKGKKNHTLKYFN